MLNTIVFIFGLFFAAHRGVVTAQNLIDTGPTYPLTAESEGTAAIGTLICRECRLGCIQVGKTDGSCPGCICDGLLLPDCPNIICQTKPDSSCASRRTIDGCAECVCFPKQSVNIPAAVAPSVETNAAAIPGNQPTTFHRQRPVHTQNVFTPGHPLSHPTPFHQAQAAVAPAVQSNVAALPGNHQTTSHTQHPIHNQNGFPPGHPVGNPNAFHPTPSLTDPSTFNQGHTINTQGSFPHGHPGTFPGRHPFVHPNNQNRLPQRHPGLNAQGNFLRGHPGNRPFHRPTHFAGQRPFRNPSRFPQGNPFTTSNNYPLDRHFSSQGHFFPGPPFGKQDALPNPDAEQLEQQQVDRELICSPIPPCPLECQARDINGCPICDCPEQNEVGPRPLSDDDPELCPPLPRCPVGCIESKLGGEFDCFDCNCTEPDPRSGGPGGFGLGVDDLPSDTFGFVLGGPADPIFDEGHECGETQCADGCILCVGRDGCGRCLCGRDSNICPSFPRCKASCIETLADSGCLSCSCPSRPTLIPMTQAIIIRRIPTFLHGRFVSKIPLGVKQKTRFAGNPKFESPELSTRLPPEVLDEIILEFSPEFITRLPEKLKVLLAGHLLSLIKPSFHSSLSPSFVEEMNPEIWFRGPLEPGFQPTFSRPLVQKPVLITTHTNSFSLTGTSILGPDPSLFAPSSFGAKPVFSNPSAKPQQGRPNVNPSERIPNPPQRPAIIPSQQTPSIGDRERGTNTSPAVGGPTLTNDISGSSPQDKRNGVPLPGPEVDAEPLPRAPLTDGTLTNVRKPPSLNDPRMVALHQEVEPIPVPEAEPEPEPLKERALQINDLPTKIEELPKPQPQTNPRQSTCIGNECHDREFLQQSPPLDSLNEAQPSQSQTNPLLEENCANLEAQPAFQAPFQPSQPTFNPQHTKCNGNNCNTIRDPTIEISTPNKANLIQSLQSPPSPQDITCIGDECTDREYVQERDTPNRFNAIQSEEPLNNPKNSDCVDCNGNDYFLPERTSFQEPTQVVQTSNPLREEVLPLIQGRRTPTIPQKEILSINPRFHNTQKPSQDRIVSVTPRKKVSWDQLPREDKIRAQLIGLLESSAFDRLIGSFGQTRLPTRSHPIDPFNPSHLFI